jgi:hypothetical protein
MSRTFAFTRNQESISSGRVRKDTTRVHLHDMCQLIVGKDRTVFSRFFARLPKNDAAADF